MGTGRKMNRLVRELVAGVGRPAPSDPVQLFERLRSYVEQREGCEVRLRFEEFPPDTVSGLMLDLGTMKVIVVERNTTTLHQLVILAHEIWHMVMGDCAAHGVDELRRSVAARMLTGEIDVREAVDVLAVAARTGFHEQEELDAENFGLKVGIAFRPFLENDAALLPGSGLAGRIQASLGSRGI
ncbi:toxin-antitoxin system, toxin component [Streptomyces sp. NPDC127112]|uniref:toxin-antitoxin system, toxin component n=1 Tax=Streptomyces sp. NPDC127112 TaxID=3345364 RepID=UPI0036349B4E